MSTDDFALPSHGTVSQCPMCKAPALDFVSITYHPQVVGYTTPEVTCRALVIDLINQQTPVPLGHDLWETFIGEHLCRKCRRCGYGWVESPLEPHSVYTPMEDEELHHEADGSPGPG